MRTRILLPLLALATFASLRAEPVEPTPAPAWTLQDLNGKPVSSSDFKGKVVLIDFWATWCGPCRTEIPRYVEMQKKYAEKGLVVIGVSLDQQGPGVVKRFVKEQHVDYLMLMGDEKIAADYGPIDAIPTTVIIDRTGRIRDRKVGTTDPVAYEAALEKILKE